MRLIITCGCGYPMGNTTNEPKFTIADDAIESCECGECEPLWFNCPTCEKSYDWWACMF